MTRYYRCLAILGLNENATLNDIKSAFRLRAKALHPDVNPSPKAKDDFLKVKRAYDYALKFKSDPQSLHRKVSFKDQSENTQTYQKRYGTHKNWNSQANQDARAKAREDAERLQKEYLNSEEYKHSVILEHFFPYIALILVVLLSGIMLFLPFRFGLKGLMAIPVLFVIAFPLWWAYVKNQYNSFSVSDFKTSLNQARQTHLFWIISFGVTSLFMFFCFTINTVISSTLLLSLFALAFLSAKLITKYMLGFKKYRQNYWAIGLIPFMLNLLFLFNYTISSNPTSETLNYQFMPYGGVYSAFDDGLIFHPNERFKDAYFLRMHFNSDKNYSKTVTYTTETGILGLSVLKQTEFSGFK